MRNYSLKHTLPGTNKQLFICSCGHQSHHTFVKHDMQCPECGNSTPFVLDTFDNLSFSEVPFTKELLYWESTSKDLYKFELNIFLIKNAYKMNFSTKKIKLLNEKYKDYQEHHYILSFNGHAYNEPMLKIINVKDPEKEYTLKSFKSEFTKIIGNFKNSNYYQRLNKNELNNADWFKYKFYNNANESMNTVVKNILTDLNKLEEYCKDYEKLIKIDIDPYNLNGQINKEGKTPAEMLKITPQSVKILKEIGSKHHNFIQIVERELKGQAINYINTFGKLDDYNIYNATRLSKLVKDANLSIPKLYKYIYKEAPIQQGLYKEYETLTLLYDSFNLAKDLGLPFDKNPKALKRYHDTLVKEHKVIADAKKNELFANVMQDFKHLEFMPDAKVIMPKEDSEEEPKIIPPEFLIKLPIDAQDLIREGKVMRHCVASYVDRVIRRETLIFFLRRTSAPNEPFCTIEVSPIDLQIRQVKGKGNRKITELEAIKTIKQWCTKKNIKWNESTW